MTDGTNDSTVDGQFPSELGGAKKSPVEESDKTVIKGSAGLAGNNIVYINGSEANLTGYTGAYEYSPGWKTPWYYDFNNYVGTFSTANTTSLAGTAVTSFGTFPSSKVRLNPLLRVTISNTAGSVTIQSASVQANIGTLSPTHFNTYVNTGTNDVVASLYGSPLPMLKTGMMNARDNKGNLDYLVKGESNVDIEFAIPMIPIPYRRVEFRATSTFAGMPLSQDQGGPPEKAFLNPDGPLIPFAILPDNQTLNMSFQWFMYPNTPAEVSNINADIIIPEFHAGNLTPITPV